jgi:hypothetical protein
LSPKNSLPNWKALDKGSAQNDLRTLRFLRNLFIPYAKAIKPAHQFGYSAVNAGTKKDAAKEKPDKDKALAKNLALLEPKNTEGGKSQNLLAPPVETPDWKATGT